MGRSWDRLGWATGLAGQQAWLGKSSVTDRGHRVVWGWQMRWSRRSRVASLTCMAPERNAWESGSAGLSTRAWHVAFPAKASRALNELHLPFWGLYIMESYTIGSWVWLLWLNIMFVRFIHTVTGSQFILFHCSIVSPCVTLPQFSCPFSCWWIFG